MYKVNLFDNVVCSVVSLACLYSRILWSSENQALLCFSYM